MDIEILKIASDTKNHKVLHKCTHKAKQKNSMFLYVAWEYIVSFWLVFVVAEAEEGSLFHLVLIDLA